MQRGYWITQQYIYSTDWRILRSDCAGSVVLVGARFPWTYYPVMRTKRVCLFCLRVCRYVGLCM